MARRKSPSTSPKQTKKSTKAAKSPKQKRVKSPKTTKKASPKATGTVPKALKEFQEKIRAIMQEQGTDYKAAVSLYRKQNGKASPKKARKAKKVAQTQKVSGQITITNPEPLKTDSRGKKIRYRHLDRHFYIRKTKDPNAPLGYKVYIEVMSRGSKSLTKSAKNTKTAGLQRYNRALSALAEKQSGSSEERKQKARVELQSLKKNKKAEYAKLLSKFKNE